VEPTAAARTIQETLGLPVEAHAELPFDSHIGELRAASQVLTAERPPADGDTPSLEGLMGRLLDEFVRSRTEEGKPVAQLWYYPVPADFAVFLSHDVDEIAWSWRRKLFMGALHPSTLREKRERYWNFSRIKALEEAAHVRSTFYIVPFGSHPRDPPYSFETLVPTVHDLTRGGWEVGVHASFESFDRPQMLAAQKRAFESAVGKPALGVRQHFINFAPQATWEYQERAGFEYDSTLANRDRAGFRTGFCHPYRPPGRRLIEIPLVIMDGQLFWYEKRDPQSAYERTMALVRRTAEYHGVASLNWHQHTMDELSFPGWWEVFERCLKDLTAMRPWFARGMDLAAWWNRRLRIDFHEKVLSPGGGSWTLMDEGGGPATVRLISPEHRDLKVAVDGTDEFEARRRGREIWIAFRELPRRPVRIDVG